MISASAEEVVLDAVSAGVLAFGLCFRCSCCQPLGLCLRRDADAFRRMSVTVISFCMDRRSRIFDFIIARVSGPNRDYFSEQCCCDDSSEKEFSCFLLLQRRGDNTAADYVIAVVKYYGLTWGDGSLRFVKSNFDLTVRQRLDNCRYVFLPVTGLGGYAQGASSLSIAIRLQFSASRAF